MIFSSRFSKRFISIASFGSILLAFASCGGSGTGEQDGWAPSSAAGYFVRIDTATGTSTGAIPGVVQLDFISNNEAIISASATLSQPFLVQGVANYIKTGKNTFTVSFDHKFSPSAPYTRTASFHANCVLDRQDTNTKYLQGVVTEWGYSGFSIPETAEEGSGSNATVIVGTSVPTTATGL